MKKLVILIVILVAGNGLLFAQKEKQTKVTGKSATITKAQYTCSMHPEIKSDKPGKCPKCKMDLVQTSKEQMKTDVMNNYTCPMHANVVSDKPGKCPKCNSALVLSQKEQMKMNVMKTFTCPMHNDVALGKGGKCPKCGMALVEKKDH